MHISDLYDSSKDPNNNLVASYKLQFGGSNNIYHDGKLYAQKGGDIGDLIDEHNEYIINSSYFRSDTEVRPKVENLIVGCSITYGIGVPEKDTWGSIISKDTDYLNMGICGAGAEFLYKKILHYIKLYGKPKNIYCLFPDFLRTPFINDLNHHYSRNKIDDIVEVQAHIKTIDEFGSSYPSEKFLRSPIDIEKTLSPHVSILHNIYSIYYLQEMCNISGINLIWSTWSDFSQRVLDHLFEIDDFILDKDKYFSLNWNILSPGNFTVLCQESHDHPRYKAIQWDKGTDLGTHPGIHWHYHVAEMFANKINSSQLQF